MIRIFRRVFFFTPSCLELFISLYFVVNSSLLLESSSHKAVGWQQERTSGSFFSQGGVYFAKTNMSIALALLMIFVYLFPKNDVFTLL